MIIDPIVIPSAVNFAKRHEPTGAVVARRITGADDPREVSKADQSKPSAGRQVTGTLFGINHSLIAGRKGKKLKAAGATLGYGTGGNIAGAVAGVGAGALLHEPALSGVAARVGAMAGGLTGQHHAVMRNQAAGRYKPQVSKGLLAPTNKGPMKAMPTIARTGPQPSKGNNGKLIRTAQIADDPIRMAARAVTKADARDRARGAAKGAAAGAGVVSTGGAAIGALGYEFDSAIRGKRKTAGGYLKGSARGAAGVWHPAAIRAGRGRTAIPVAAGAGLGALVARSRRRQPVAKAYRSFDPEDARQRRLGAMAAGSALGGAALVATGGREIRRDSRSLGEHVRGARESVEVDHKKRSLLRGISELPDKKAALVRARSGGKVAGGAALLAGAGRLMSDRHKKPWR